MMSIVFTVGFYLLANILLWAAVRSAKISRGLWLLPGAAALLLHGYLLYHWIDYGHLQNLAWVNVVSMTLWLAGILVWSFSLTKPVENLTLFIFPLTILSIIACVIWQTPTWVDAGVNMQLLAHILLAVLAISTWWIALAQALLLSAQNHLLRQQVNWLWLQWLPNLETMEDLLFQFIQVSFIILTITLFSALWLMQPGSWQYVLPKSILGGLAWLVDGALLVGRYRFGWRGKTAVRGTLTGFIFLMLAYIGSQLFF
jgi:ABC-type uncharacterized transport system permease subunit